MKNRIIDVVKTETKTAKWFITSLKEGNLYVDNSFQRNYVWSHKDQVGLIETILLGYSIPEIYLYNENVDPDTGDVLVSVVDGQQRIGAVKSFINNEFVLKKNMLKFEESDFSDKLFSDLTPEQKTAIWSYPFTCHIIPQSISKEEIVEIFLRLNATNKGLNSQELRNAGFNGCFANAVDELSKNEFWNEVFSISQIQRMKNNEFTSQILIYFRMGIESDANQKAMNDAYDIFNVKYEEKENDIQRFNNIIDVIRELFENPEIKATMKKITNLYTLIVVVDNLILTNEMPFEVFQKGLLKFVNSLNVGESDKNLEKLVAEYSALIVEGTQSKSNRTKRAIILTKYLRNV